MKRSTHTPRRWFCRLFAAFLLLGGAIAVGAESGADKQTVLITGANRGLGLELSRQFAADDYYVIGTARSPEKATELKQVADEVLQLDVTSDESIKGLAKALDGKAIDILVNNAGYFGPTLGLGSTREKSATLETLTRSEVLDCFAVNAAGPIFVTQGLIPNLLASEQPKVVVISSRSGIINQSRNAGAYGYRISKTAVNRAVKIMSVDKALRNAIVVAIAPGHNRTDMGGDRAKLTPEESMKMVKGLIETLTPKHDGGFWYYDGKELPW
ncbi:MAG: SDR family oxidoreductase [Verrucomicrobiales bacterium]